MGKVKFSAQAAVKVKKACAFYGKFDPTLSPRVRVAIVSSLSKLLDNPNIGRPWPLNLAYREKVIPFGASNFLALYQIDERNGDILILALRHEREKGYDLDET